MVYRNATIFLITAVALQSHVVAQPARTDSTHQARLLLIRAKASVLRVKNDFQSSELLDEIGVAQAKAGDLEGAVDSSNRAYLPAIRTMEAIGDALADSNDAVRARSLATRLKEGRSFTFFSYMAKSYAKKGRFAEALAIAEQISFAETRSYALEGIAQRQMIAGDLEGARKTLERARAAHPKGLMDADELEAFRLSQQLARGEEQQVRAEIANWEPEKKFAWLIGGAEELRQRGRKAAALKWLDDAFREMSSDAKYEFFRYFAIPIQVRLGEEKTAFDAADNLSGEMRVKGYMAVAVTCAEDRNVGCVDAAIEKMKRAKTSLAKLEGVSDFALKMMILNITAALIDNKEFQAALRWLSEVEKNNNDYTSILPRSQLQRVTILAQEKKFPEARSLSLHMRRNSVTDLERGRALRITTLLETKSNGLKSSERWATSLKDVEDRAYALLGVAQALLDVGETRLGYTAITVH